MVFMQPGNLHETAEGKTSQKQIQINEQVMFHYFVQKLFI